MALKAIFTKHRIRPHEGRQGRAFIEYFPPAKRERMRHVRLHNDPEFETFTYGDPTQPKRSLRRLKSGDWLIFYAGLQGWRDCKTPPGLFLVGYFEVEHGGLYPELCAELAVRAVRRLFRNNPHVKYGNPASHDKLTHIEKTLIAHDGALRDIYERIRPLLLPPPELPKGRIGFHAEP